MPSAGSDSNSRSRMRAASHAWFWLWGHRPDLTRMTSAAETVSNAADFSSNPFKASNTSINILKSAFWQTGSSCWTFQSEQQQVSAKESGSNHVCQTTNACHSNHKQRLFIYLLELYYPHWPALHIIWHETHPQEALWMKTLFFLPVCSEIK